jgi:hypothetical protein
VHTTTNFASVCTRKVRSAVEAAATVEDGERIRMVTREDTTRVVAYIRPSHTKFIDAFNGSRSEVIRLAIELLRQQMSVARIRPADIAHVRERLGL